MRDFILEKKAALVALLLLSYGSCNAGESTSSNSMTPLVSKDKEINITKILGLLEKNSFRNISCDFSMTESIQKKEGQNSSVSSWVSGKMSVSGEPESLIKVIYTPNTYTWVNGAAPYIQKNEGYAYNGKYWIYVLYDSGIINSLIPCNIAQISENCPADWTFPRLNTPEMFFINHTRFDGRQTLLQTFLELSKVPDFLKTLNPILEGNNLKLSLLLPLPPAKPDQKSEIWLDLSKNGALKKLTIDRGLSRGEKSQSRTEYLIENYINCGGIYFPSKAKRTYKDSERLVINELVADNYSLIDDSADLYEVKLKPGTRVTDKRTNTAFVVGAGIEQTIKAIEKSQK